MNAEKEARAPRVAGSNELAFDARLLDKYGIPSPAFIVDLGRLRRNCELLADVQRRSGAKVLLALKGFATWSTFDFIRPYLAGTTASGPFEAKLGREEFGGEVHVYAPVYSQRDIDECLPLCDHVVFNSFDQWHRYKEQCVKAARERKLHFGLRVNPEHSEVLVPLYDPCRPGSRLGIRREAFAGQALDGISGLHFHTLCELGADALERTLSVFEERFGDLLQQMSWVNFGGGHHITRPNYDLERLVEVIRRFKARHNLEVYLEPGEAVALDAGVLVATVLDVIENQGQIAMLDVSATAHMPDVLEMPYRPVIDGAGEPGAFKFDYRLGGVTCLAGDEIGAYSFAGPLKPGERLVFRDMAIYTIVKTTMFNGVRHPAIALFEPTTESLKLVREFGYDDYKSRLS